MFKIWCFIYSRLFKKINTFINYRNVNDSYYYEYLYYSYLKFDFLDIKTIKINDCNTDISIYNNLSSKNRREFNILNIPFQKEIDNKIFKEENSLLVLWNLLWKS